MEMNSKLQNLRFILFNLSDIKNKVLGSVISSLLFSYVHGSGISTHQLTLSSCHLSVYWLMLSMQSWFLHYY